MNPRIIAFFAVALAVGVPTAAIADPPARLPDPIPPSRLPDPVPAPSPKLAPPKVDELPAIPMPPEPESPSPDQPPAKLPPTVAPPAAPPAMQMPPTQTGPRPGSPAYVPRPLPPNTHFGPPDDYWWNVGYLSYQFKAAPLGPTAAVAADATGTRVLVGGGHADFGWANGLTVNGGSWLNERHTFGVGLGGFLTEQRAAGDLLAAGSDRTLTRPFVNALTNELGQFFVAAPGFLSGSYRVESTARLAGAEAYLLKSLAHEQQLTFDLVAGFRYLDLDESLRLTQTTTPTDIGFILLGGNAFPGGTPLTITDRFRTRNQFYGGEFGVAGEWRLGPACFGLTPKVGFGTNHQTVQVDGSSSVPGTILPGGFFALPGGNTGRTGQDRFTLLAEVRAEVGVYLTGHSRLSVGYDFLYLNDVARPANQIDMVVNPRLVPTARAFGSLSGVASPVPTAGQTDFIAHGLRVVLEYRY